MEEAAPTDVRKRDTAHGLQRKYPTSLLQRLWVWTSRLSAGHFLYSCIVHNMCQSDRTPTYDSWSNSFSHSHSTILRWDLKLWCPGDEKSLGSPTQALKYTTPSAASHDIWLMMTMTVSRGRMRWVNSFLVGLLLATWCPQHAVLRQSLAFRAVHWLAGTVQLGPRWLDTCGGFLRREESGHEAGCSCWCSYGFMSSLTPTQHSGDRMEGALKKLCAVNSW